MAVNGIGVVLSAPIACDIIVLPGFTNRLRPNALILAVCVPTRPSVIIPMEMSLSAESYWSVSSMPSRKDRDSGVCLR